MSRRLFSNNAYGTLTDPVGNAGTLLRITGNYVGNFPTPGASDLVFITVQGDGPDIEIMQLVDRTGSDLTVVRAQEGTIARSFATGSLVELRTTAAALNAFAQIDKDETVTGNWTFTQQVTIPLVPTSDPHAASKQYVDNLARVRSVTGDIVDNTDPKNPVVNRPTDTVLSVTGNGVDNTDPRNPAVSAIQSVTGARGTTVTPTDTENVVVSTPSITVSASEPTAGDGADGDIWFVVP